MSTTDAQIEQTLTRQILAGTYPPGTRLPSMRALAGEHDVTVNTVQRAVARLERAGLVQARQGSGLTVQDPQRCGDLSLLPAWFEALADNPPRAAELLRGFLEVRRVLAAHFLVQHRRTFTAHSDDLRAAATRIIDHPSPQGVRDADLDFARRLIELAGSPAARMVLSTAFRVMGEVEGLAEAMYARPAHNVAVAVGILQALASGDDDSRVQWRVLETLAQVDDLTVRRFRTLLADRLPADAEAGW
ncbi:MAG: GntR family transcriptional regulator [Myxococcales bacterium]|nr:GntR family transcriptional regulator [Myxococcales bacterium]